MSGLWRYNEKTKGGKYLVTRRDGTTPKWLYIVLGSRDPDASDTVRFYADRCEVRGRDPQYVADLRRLADEMDEEAKVLGHSLPDAAPERADDPAIAETMRLLNGA